MNRTRKGHDVEPGKTTTASDTARRSARPRCCRFPRRRGRAFRRRPTRVGCDRAESYRATRPRGCNPMNHIPFGDTPVSRCTFYRRVCDLPANVDPPQLGRIVMKVEHVGALTMPAHLGHSVKTHMRQRGLDLGPVCSHPRQNRWTYLVRPDIPDDVRVFAEMYRLDVQVIRAGGTVALPSPADQGIQFRRWIEPPRCTFRPSGLVVVDTIRACSTPYRPVRRWTAHV